MVKLAITAPACPGDGLLLDYLGGALAAADLPDFESHLDRCDPCQRRLDAASHLAAQEPLPSAASLVAGSRLGRFVVEGKLGAGAMGEVLAGYDPELDRSVALKVVVPRPSQSSAVDRLLREARAMARLAHPNVRGVYEVGLSGDRIFLALELVRGRTLRRYLAEERPGWREILELFVQAGLGLRAAHEGGVVHRDFKPDNVLVADDGRVLVTDFGLALCGDDSRPPSVQAPGTSDTSSDWTGTLTASGAFVGTPAYMPPEQWQGLADERSDQFSFCVALVEALSGERPIQEPLIPRGRRPLRLEPIDLRRVPRRAVRRALERGLHLDPDLRHPSMAALLEHLEPPRRRSRVIGLGVAVLVSVLAGASTAWWHETKEEGGKEAPLEGLWGEDQRTQIREAFLASGNSLASAHFDHFASAMDETVESLRTAFAHLQVALPATEPSPAQRCLWARQDEIRLLLALLQDSPDSRAVERAGSTLDSLAPASTCLDPAAAGVWDRTGALRGSSERRDGMDQELTRAELLVDLGRWDEAGGLLDRLLRESKGQPDQLGVAHYLLARIHEDNVRHEEAAIGFAEAAQASAEGADPVGVARAWTRLAFVVGEEQARRDEAATWFRAAEVAIAQAGDPPVLRATWHSGMAIHHARGGEADRARAHHERAVSLQEEHQGPAHPQLAKTLAVAAILWVEAGRRPDEAATRQLARAVSLIEASRGPDHPDVARLLTNYGALLAAEGRLDEAAQQYERSLPILENSLGSGHPHVAIVINNLGGLQHRQRRYAQAAWSHTRAFAMFEEAGLRDHPSAATSALNAGFDYLELGQVAVAKTWFRRALERFESLAEEPPGAAMAQAGLGDAMLRAGDARGAVRALEQALQKLRRRPTVDADLAFTSFALARALWAEHPRNRSRALALAQDANEIFREQSNAGIEATRVRDWLTARGHR